MPIGTDLPGCLEQVAGLLRRYGNERQARVVESLVELYRDDRDLFWTALDRDEVWGSRNSVAELGLAEAGHAAPGELARDRAAFFRAMVAIAGEMDRRGIHNRKAMLWAQRFAARPKTL